MKLMLALALAFATPDGGDSQKHLSVRNATALVENDWWEFEVGTAQRSLSGGKSRPRTVTASQLRLLSLLPKDRWDSGSAWMIEFTGTDEDSGMYRAFQGRYQFSGEQLDDDTLLLSLRFPRMYSAAARPGRLDWNLEVFSYSEPTGVTIEIPLEGRSVPADEVRYIVPKGFFIDSAGNPIVKIVGAGLFSRGREKTVDRTEYVEIGEVLRLTDRPVEDDPGASIIAGRLLLDPPPGFHLREAEKTPAQLAAAAYERREYSLAIALYSTVIEANPRDARAYRYRADSRARRGDIARAIADYTEALRIEPNHAESLRERGRLHAVQGEFPEAILDYSKVVGLNPRDLSARNALARLLATCPEDDLRNGQRAYELAKLNCEATSLTDPVYLDTLAAAYAELQDFRNAVEFQSRALSLASTMEKEDYRPRLELYRQRKPYREPRPSIP